MPWSYAGLRLRALVTVKVTGLSLPPGYASLLARITSSAGLHLTVIDPQDRPAVQAADSGERLPVLAGTHRGWSISPALQGVLALAIYLLAWLSTSARPLIQHLGWAKLDQLSMDPNFYTWCLRWWPYAVSHALNPLYTHQIAAPAGQSLGWVTTVPPLALLAAPLTLAAGPVTTLNLLTAIALPVSAWAAFLLCRRLTGKFWASLAGGAVFGFSAYEVNHASAGQLNLIFSLLLPILAYLIVVWRDGSITSRTFVILAGLTMALQFYLFLETFADLTAILVIALLVGLALAGASYRPAIARLAKVLGLAYLIAIALALPYLSVALAGRPPKLRAVTGLDLASLVVPRPQRTYGIAWLAHAASGPVNSSAAGYVGIPLLLLALLLAVTRWSSKIVRFLTCMLVLIVVAAFGPDVYLEGKQVARLPWAGLWNLPFLRNAWASRLMLFAFLVLAVATALWLAAPGWRTAWLRWSLAALVIASIAADTLPLDLTTGTTVPRFITSGQYRRQLAPGEIVIVVSNIGNAGMLWQAQSDFYMRISGGFINAGLSHRTDLPRQVQELAHATPAYVAQFERFVKSHHIGAVLLDESNEPQWVGIFRRVGLVGHITGGVVVYPTHDCQACHGLVSPHHHSRAGGNR